MHISNVYLERETICCLDISVRNSKEVLGCLFPCQLIFATLIDASPLVIELQIHGDPPCGGSYVATSCRELVMSSVEGS